MFTPISYSQYKHELLKVTLQIGEACVYRKKNSGEHYTANLNIDSEIITGNVFFPIISNKNKFIYDFKCYILALRAPMRKENSNASYVSASYIFFCHAIYLYTYMENIHVRNWFIVLINTNALYL